MTFSSKKLTKLCNFNTKLQTNKQKIHIAIHCISYQEMT